MILLINVILTDERINDDVLRQHRLFLDYPHRPYKYDKVDIFKYMLASLAPAYDWSKVLIFCALDDKYKEKQQELQKFIEQEFVGHNLRLEFYRNEYQKDWQKLYEELDDDIIWYSCNHDHIYMDYATDVLEDGVELLKGFEERGEKASIYPSHWPELLNAASHNHNEKNGPIHVYDKYIGFHLLNNCDSFQIINKTLYRHWWMESDYGDAYLPRSDYRLAQNGKIGYDIRNHQQYSMLNHSLLIPLRQQCIHYDGYGHVAINPNKFSSLCIPPGFFERDIKIRYGYLDNKEDCVNINPAKKYYSIIDKMGTDYKILLDDLPLFWHNKISNIDINPDITEDMLSFRNQAFIEMATSRIQIQNNTDQTLLDQWWPNFKKNALRQEDA